ncbi:MAG: serine/threonine-protein kinase [Acidimicrobiales bacterium]
MPEQTDQATVVVDATCPRCGGALDGAAGGGHRCAPAPPAGPGADGGAGTGPSAELAAGTALAEGRYVVVAVLGRGGFGITYDAVDTRLQRPVAIKELFPEGAVRHGGEVAVPSQAPTVEATDEGPAPGTFEAARERFIREARVLARFTHPGVVRVYEVFEEHGTAYLVMERLTGRTLVDVLRARKAPFTPDEVLDVAGRVAAALRPIHAAGVLHRDVNPTNVMLTEHGRIVLIDFGLARDFEVDRTVGMTRLVTPGYAPIEQYQGEARFGPATDVYGLAATLYRLATGRIPVSALERSAGKELPSPHRLVDAVPKALSDGILDGLELDPGHRPQDMDALLARLGVRRLPEGTRSLLLGSRGAEPEVLAAHRPKPLPSPPSGAVAPVPSDERATELVARATPVAEEGTRPDPATSASDGGTRPDAAPPATLVVPPPPAVVPAPAPGGAALAPDVAALAERAAADRQRRVALLAPALAVVALGSSLPVVIVGLLVLVVFPLLATVGDHVGLDAPRRVPTPVLAPARFARNLFASALRTSPILGLFALGLALWYGLDATSLSQGLVDALLRVVGAGAVAALLLSVREGSSRFRTGPGLDAVARWWAPDARITQRIVVGWVVCLAVGAIGLWLVPDAWPLPS